jgi:cell division initiation protein
VSLTPVELRHIRFPRRPLGYSRGTVEDLLERVAASFEDVWRDRADLRDEVERLESEVARYKELDVLLRNSLVSAERAADELRAQAGREADVILHEARVRAREITAVAEAERERVRAEVRRLRSLETEVRSGYRSFLVTALDGITGERGYAAGQAVGTGGAVNHADPPVKAVVSTVAAAVQAVFPQRFSGHVGAILAPGPGYRYNGRVPLETFSGPQSTTW